MRTYLDFEKPVAEIEAKVEELRAAEPSEAAEEIARLELKAGQALQELYAELTPWQKTQVARHPQRPHCLDYVSALVSDFTPMAGDRKYGEDEAIIGGFGRFQGESICIIGHEKGATTESRLRHNFGMARPEGYRKALRLMKLAERFGRPVIAFIDTPGAYPGLDAEERGQAEAIAVCIEEMAALTVPVVSLVIGEGGSGGALAIGVANRMLMLQYSWYSVISPESCAAILYRDSSKGDKAAEALKLTARDAFELGIVDQLVDEAPGGAHRDWDATAQNIRLVLRRHLRELRGMSPEQLVQDRYEKFRKLGPITEPSKAGSA